MLCRHQAPTAFVCTARDGFMRLLITHPLNSTPVRRKDSRSQRPLAVVLSLAVAAGAAKAATLSVRVNGVSATDGEIGCALFTDAAGFPLDTGPREQRWLAAGGDARLCEFKDLPAGRYAVAATLDDNGNRRPDTNLLGMPKEAWGVSNNVRPRLRAPSFDEAALQLETDAQLEITVDVRR